MVTGIVSSILEITLALWCLHLMNQKRMKLKFSLILIVSLNIFLMELINRYQLPGILMMLVYLAMGIYCIVEFDDAIKEMFIDVIIVVMNMVLMQAIAMLLLIIIISVYAVDTGIFVICNGMVAVQMLLFERYIGYTRIKKYVMDKSWLSRFMILFSVISTGIGLLNAKQSGMVPTWFFIWVTFFCTFMFCMWYRWMKQRELVKEHEADLNAQKLYYDSYERMLKELREKQHDYKNHMQALQNEQFLNKNFHADEEGEEAEEYKRYYRELMHEDRYSGLLKCRNPIISGFLFEKIKEAEGRGISVDYHVELFRERYQTPTYIIIEAAGILLDNAIEASAAKEKHRTISLKMKETEKGLCITVKNGTKHISASEFMTYFEQDYSTKGTGRGIGLYKVKKYAEKYKWEIQVDITEQDEKTYVEVCLMNVS